MKTIVPERSRIQAPGGDMELFFDIDEAGPFPVGNVILSERSLPVQDELGNDLTTET